MSSEDRCSCGERAAVFLHYANRALCKGHFIEMFERRVGRTIRERRMLKANERILVGLSGGKDSCVLLHSLAALNMPLELVAVTIDEGIEGYREKTLKTAIKECRKLGIEHHAYPLKEHAGRSMDEIASLKENTPCSYCGVLRRYLLNKAAKELNADKIATGHNLDDVAQTLIMNIMRNEPSRIARSGCDGFIPRIRPLMRTPEREIAIYAMMKGIELDNMDCPYAHHAFRSHVRGMLNKAEERYPGTKYKILGSYMGMEKALRGMDAGRNDICIRCGEPCSGKECMYCRTVASLK